MEYNRIDLKSSSVFSATTSHRAKKTGIWEYRRFLFAFAFAVVLFFTVLFLLPKRSASAGNTSNTVYRIASVQIEQGDSLWSIAAEYYTNDFSTLKEYIKEIKRMNCLKDDTIYAGGYLLIPYYAE